MIDLSDTSVLIPVRIDSDDRRENLDIVVTFLRKYFKINVHIQEHGRTSCVSPEVKRNTDYVYVQDNDPLFRRTRILNQMIGASKTPFAIIYDADVIVAPDQLFRTISTLRSHTADFVLPFDGRFVLVDAINKKLFGQNTDFEFLSAGYRYFAIASMVSAGGCFAFVKDSYLKCGLENENITGWGHDDVERIRRIRKLGNKLSRVSGPLYHLDHSRHENSGFFDDAARIASYEAYFHVCSVAPELLLEEIQAWPWCH